MKKNIAIFASGSGSDMQSVVDATLSGAIDGKVVALVTNKADIFAIQRADKHGIEHRTFALADYADESERDRAIVEYLRPLKVDLIVLAGYLAIVTPILVDAYPRRIINIHPSLIPKHCGRGMYGLRVHKSVIDSGDKVSGCTVHFVDYGADTGEIIAQEQVEVRSGDTPESLQARVLEVEHRLLPYVVAKLCRQRINEAARGSRMSRQHKTTRRGVPTAIRRSGLMPRPNKRASTTRESESQKKQLL